MIFNFGMFVLNIDVDRTREFYSKAKVLTDR